MSFRSLVALAMIAMLAVCTLVPIEASAKPKPTVSKSSSDSRVNTIRNFRS